MENEGFRAHYYPGTMAPDTAVIAVDASSCDEKTSIAMADYLRRAGRNVLVLGYYRWKGLPKDLGAVPLDYAEKAVRWLREERKIEKIAMTGASAGAAYTLSCAARIPEIGCVMAVVPYDYVTEGTSGGTKRLHTSCFAWHGEEVPYTALSLMDRGLSYWLRGARKAEGYGLRRFLRWGYDQQEQDLDPASRIRVEDMHADVLLLGVKDDDCWPSDAAVPRMAEVLRACGYPHRVQTHIYEKASHALTDGLGSMRALDRFELRLMFPAEKKYPRECEQARQDSFRRILRFLDEWE